MHVTSSGRHGGCKEDKDEQSSLPVCELEAHDFCQAQPDALPMWSKAPRPLSSAA